MKKLLLSLGACLAIASASFSQTTLFQDDFENGTSLWTFSGLGGNAWTVNNAYTGWPGLINDTPNQPGGIGGSPQSNYMHIVNGTVCGGLAVCNANYDTGSTSTTHSEVASAVNASTYTNITVEFWYLCVGETGTAYGTMEYSLDGGATWVGTGTNYVNTGVWTQETVTMAAWDNAPSFKIRFTWQNSGGSGSDPSFSIDDFEIYGTSGGGGSNTITTGTNIQPTSWCEGTMMTLQVDFTSTGTFSGGNIYSAELSDGSGSFAAPLVIGTLPSTANSGMIVSVVPGTVPPGTGYRIRVVSDNPATIGSDNGTDLTIHPLPDATLQTFVDVCDNAGLVTLIGGSPAGGTYSGTGVSAGMFDPSVGSSTITYTYTDGNGCTDVATEPITVIPAPTVTLDPFTDVCDDDPFFTLTGGQPAGGTYTGPGVSGGVFDPTVAGAGTHTLTYTYTAANGCAESANSSIFVDQCGSIGENGMNHLVLYPNPATESFSLISESTIESVEILDMAGRTVKVFNENKEVYEVSEVPTGVYFVTVKTSDNTTQLRIVIE